MQPELLMRLRTMAGELAPRSLGFMEGPVAGSPSAAPPVFEAAPAEPARPAASLVEAAAAIDDSEVRRAFLETAGRYLARGTDKKGR
jgi:hypothetical protein